MIWNAWVLGLLVGQAAVAAVNLVAFCNAFGIVAHWDTNSLSPVQLNLERRSELISAVVSWSLFFQILSLLVFEITARSLAPSIPGAMCTVGSLQAHYLGWPILFLKMASIYLYGWWILINHVDLNVEGFPLTRFKAGYMLVLFPLLLADLGMQVIYFTGLDSGVISSCCGVVFEVGGEGFGSSVASLSPRLTRILLVSFISGMIFVSLIPWFQRSVWGRLCYSLAAANGLVLGLAGVVSFVAPYVYMMPALHCPFIFLDREHMNFGYLVYLPLFIASFLGMSVGLLTAIERAVPGTGGVTAGLEAKFVRHSRFWWIAFLAAAYAPAVRFWIATGGRADLFGVGY